MSNRQAFAETIISLDSGLNRAAMNECYTFGMVWGCKFECPGFQNGNCPEPHEAMKAFIEEGEEDPDDMQEMIDKYGEKMEAGEREELERMNES